MRVMMVGDVVGTHGVAKFREKIPAFKRKNRIDFIIANGENSAQGNGILPSSADALLSAGCDCITTGNHALRRREIFNYMDENPYVIRPLNFYSSAPGNGYYIIDTPPTSILVVNLIGTAYLDSFDNPFEKMDALLEKKLAPVVIVDFHAEATSEKLCMGHYLDGRVSLVVGTHTHVPTADARILPNGTGYVTDLGMCGGLNSILGVKKELAIARMKTHLPTRFENDPNDVVIQGIIAEIDEKTFKTVSIERFELS